MPGVPLTDAERAEILRLHGEGLSRGAIARKTGRGPATVTRVVHEAGRTFERPPELVEATEAKALDNAAKRAKLQGLLLDDALRIREKLWQPTVVFNWSKDNDFAQRTLPEPDAATMGALMRTVGVAVDKAARLAEQDRAATNPEAAVSLLGTVVDGLRAKYADPEGADGDLSAPDDEPEGEPE